MRAVSEILLNYAGEIVVLEIAVFAVLMITFQIRHLRYLRKMHRMAGDITEKMKAYFQVVMSEDGERDETPDGFSMSRQEAEMRRSLESKKRQQEEAVIDAVLQEIFP